MSGGASDAPVWRGWRPLERALGCCGLSARHQQAAAYARRFREIRSPSSTMVPETNVEAEASA